MSFSPTIASPPLGRGERGAAICKKVLQGSSQVLFKETQICLECLSKSYLLFPISPGNVRCFSFVQNSRRSRPPPPPRHKNFKIKLFRIFCLSKTRIMDLEIKKRQRGKRLNSLLFKVLFFWGGPLESQCFPHFTCFHKYNGGGQEERGSA